MSVSIFFKKHEELMPSAFSSRKPRNWCPPAFSLRKPMNWCSQHIFFKKTNVLATIIVENTRDRGAMSAAWISQAIHAMNTTPRVFQRNGRRILGFSKENSFWAWWRRRQKVFVFLIEMVVQSSVCLKKMHTDHLSTKPYPRAFARNGRPFLGF